MASSPVAVRESTAQHRAQKMMSLAPDQFEELIICHISRRLELNDGKLDELINGISKSKNPVSSIKKASLKRIASPFQARRIKPVCDKENPCADLQVSPQVFNALSKLISSLSVELKVEGVFRKSGNCTRVKQLKQRLLENCNCDMSPYTTHDRATAVKHLLNDMPEPLLMERHFEAFRQAVALSNNGMETAHHRCLRVMQLLMLRLPRNNLLLVRRLLGLLNAVAEEEANKMDSTSLATLFAPHLLCSKQLQSNPVIFNSALSSATESVNFMIKNSTKIFHVPSEFSRDVAQFFRSEERLSEEFSNPSTPVKSSADVGVSPMSVSLTFSARSASSASESKDTTSLELAKLQAHIQSLPQTEKRKLSKQLNDITVMHASSPSCSQDTPCKYKDTPRKHFRSKSLGSSIRKRLPMFRSKTKHPAACIEDYGAATLTAVKIDFEDTPQTTVTAKHRPGPRPSGKRAASSHVPSPHNCRRYSDGDVTPPKVAHRESTEPNTPHVPSPGMKCRPSPLPSTENEKDFIPAPDHHQDKLRHKVLSPLQEKPAELTVKYSHSCKESPQRNRSRSRQPKRPLSAMSSPANFETAL